MKSSYEDNENMVGIDLRNSMMDLNEYVDDEE
jgi:hypothetical protein